MWRVYTIKSFSFLAFFPTLVNLICCLGKACESIAGGGLSIFPFHLDVNLLRLEILPRSN